MKIKFLIAYLFFFMSCDHKWKKEIDDLQKQIDLNSQLIEQLLSNIFITKIENFTGHYVIYFSDNSSLSIVNGYVAFVSIGANGNWFINEIDTDIKANGPQPEIKIGANGNWFINQVDTNVSYHLEFPVISINKSGNWEINGEDSGLPSIGQDAPYISSIIINEGYALFSFSDGSEILVPIMNSSLKKVVCWGNSLTVGVGGGGVTYPGVLQLRIGKNYEVINAGVSGENSLTIAARQGGIPMYLNQKIEFTVDENEIMIGVKSNTNLKSTYDDTDVLPLLRGGGATINNCYIDGLECVLKWTGSDWQDEAGAYTLSLSSEITKGHIIPSGSLVFTSAMKNLRNAHANVLFIGQNGGWDSNAELVDQINKMIEFSGSTNCLVIGLHARGTVLQMNTLEEIMSNEYGARYINLRKHMVERALEEAGLSATEADLEAMSNGLCPPQLLADELHFNAIGYRIIGDLVAKRFELLGI
ncbi:MAG: lysophospholipase L1-like esterase [Parvicella sp.]|jgi:lysophospholipase L1-like esterase